jgi:hypothetical protein
MAVSPVSSYLASSSSEGNTYCFNGRTYQPWEISVSCDPGAILAYGYDLGGSEGEWLLKEYDEDEGIVKVPWLADEDSEEWLDDFGTEATNVLLAKLTDFNEKKFTEEGRYNEEYYRARSLAEKELSVEIISFGHHESSSYALIMKVYHESAEWGVATVLEDLENLIRSPVQAAWDAKLAEATAALGITPLQKRPGWLLMADYG